MQFLTTILRRSGDDANIAKLEKFFRNEADRFRVLVAILYGSWAGCFPRRDSDIDIAVVFEDEPDDDDVYLRLMAMSLLLSNLMGREVNMIPIYLDFRKPMLYYNAIVQGIPVFAKRPADFNLLRKKAIDEMEDFSLFGLQWQAALARRNLEALKHA